MWSETLAMIQKKVKIIGDFSGFKLTHKKSENYLVIADGKLFHKDFLRMVEDEWSLFFEKAPEDTTLYVEKVIIPNLLPSNFFAVYKEDRVKCSSVFLIVLGALDIRAKFVLGSGGRDDCGEVQVEEYAIEN